MPGESEGAALASGGEDLLTTGGEAGGSEGGAGEGAEIETGYEAGTMEDTAVKTLREINARNKTADDGGAEDGDEIDPATGRAREKPTGKFKTTQAKAGDGAAAEIDPATGKPKVAAPGADAPHKVLPTTWKRELAPKFAALDPEVQQEIHRRETDARNGVAMYRKDADFARQLAGDFIVPYQQDFAAAGVTPQQGIKTVMDTWSGLVRAAQRGDKGTIVGILSQLNSDFGITASDLTDPRDGGQSQGGHGDSPKIRALEQEIAELRGTLQGQQQQREQAEVAALQTEFAKFRADPANEFVDAVKEVMSRLILAGEASNYREAYDKACWLDANVRAKLTEREAAKQRNHETAQAAAARKAAGVKVPARGAAPQAAKPGTIDDTLRSTYRQIQARG